MVESRGQTSLYLQTMAVHEFYVITKCEMKLNKTVPELSVCLETHGKLYLKRVSTVNVKIL